MIRARQVAFVVSGDESVRSEVQCVLVAHGVQAIAFESAAAYMAWAKPDSPACIILDVSLPDMCGLELQQQLAATCAPVLFVTRCADIAFTVRAIKAGALDFLTLPFAPETLMSVVRSALALDAANRMTRERMTGLRQRFERLTPRERQVLQSVVSGRLNKQVAVELGISDITVQVHRRRVMRKMGAACFADLVRIAGTLRIPLGGGRQSENAMSGAARLAPRQGGIPCEQR